MSDEETIRQFLAERSDQSNSNAWFAFQRLIAAKEQAEKERDEALPWKLFYGDGKNLGEVAANFGKTIYDFSPWLAAPIVRAARNAVMEESARIESLTARLRSMCEAMEPFANAATRSDVPEIVLIPDGHALLFRPGPNGPVVAITEGDLRRARAELDASKKEIGK